MTEPERIAAGRGWCWPWRHEWKIRVIVPGVYVNTVTHVCERCGKGEREYRQAFAEYARYLERQADNG